MYQVKTARSSIELEVDTSQVQVIIPATDNSQGIILECQKIHYAVEIIINGHRAQA